MTRTLTSGSDAADPLPGRVKRRWNRYWTLAVLTAGADVLTTHAGLAVGLTEGNPYLAAVIGAVGVGGIVAVKALAIGVAALTADTFPGQWDDRILLGMAVPWALAAAVNAVRIVTVS